jgi:hypothetical protein
MCRTLEPNGSKERLLREQRESLLLACIKRFGSMNTENDDDGR